MYKVGDKVIITTDYTCYNGYNFKDFTATILEIKKSNYYINVDKIYYEIWVKDYEIEKVEV